MDLQNMEEFNCQICFCQFNDNLKCPRMLPCGHSYCYSCLKKQFLISSLCPTCKADIKLPSADLTPINFLIKSIVSRMSDNNCVTNKRKRKSSSNEALSDKKFHNLKSVGFCEEHKNVKEIRCMDSGLWLCGMCVFLEHKHCRTLLVEEALKEMQQSVSQKVEAELKVRKEQNSHANKFLHLFEDKHNILKQEIKVIQLELKSKIEKLKAFGKGIAELQLLKSSRNKFCEELKQFETSVINSIDNEEFSKYNLQMEDFLQVNAQKLREELTIPKQCHGLLTVEDVRNLCEKESCIYTIRHHPENIQYGKVTTGNRIWVHSFLPQEPIAMHLLFSFRELLSIFTRSCKLPQKALLQLGEETSALDDIVFIY